MRRELAIKVDYLDPLTQERIQQQSSQRLIPPWALDEHEQMEHAAILYPRSFHRDQDYGGHVYLSPRGGFGQYVRRPLTFPDYQERLRIEDSRIVCLQLLEALRVAGLTEVIAPPRDADDVPGYQLPASALCWVAEDGTRPFHDPSVCRAPPQPEAAQIPFSSTSTAPSPQQDKDLRLASTWRRCSTNCGSPVRRTSTMPGCPFSTAPPPWNLEWILLNSTS